MSVHCPCCGQGIAAPRAPIEAFGNSWAINVFRWVGERIEMVEELCAEIEHQEAAE